MLYNGWNCLHRGEFWYFRCCKNWLHQVNSFFRERWSFLSQPDQSNLRIHLCKKKKTFFKDDDIFRIRGAKRYYISTSRKNCFVALLKNSKEFSHKWRNLFLLLKFFDLVSNKRFTLLLWMNVTTGSFMGRKKLRISQHLKNTTKFTDPFTKFNVRPVSTSVPDFIPRFK